jgi:hypothetical protein
MFESIINNIAYQEGYKDWFITLSYSSTHWYDLIINPQQINITLDTKQIITNQLKLLKQKVEKELEKRFIYFIYSRTKVRFNTSKIPTYNPLSKTIKLHLLIGKNHIKKSIKIKITDILIEKYIFPKVILTDKFITFYLVSGHTIISSVHDLLNTVNINLGINSKVQYVGYTKNPNTRPINGIHAGLSEVLYNVSADNNDIFITFNLFKVTTQSLNKDYKFNFIIPNSMSNEIDVDLEGQILEKCLILFFDSNNQTKNKEKEYQELKNNLLKISNKNKINSIQFYYEFERYNEYWFFYSSKVKANSKHIFTFELKDNSVQILPMSKLYSELVEPFE